MRDAVTVVSDGRGCTFSELLDWDEYELSEWLASVNRIQDMKMEAVREAQRK